MRLAALLIKTLIFCCGLCLWSLPAQAQNFQAINIDLENGKLHAKVFGEGDPLLLINGGPGFHSDGFISLADKLSDEAKVIIYDQRGTGQSSISEINASTISLDAMIEDIELLRKHLGYDEWIIMGHSFGGMLTYAYARRYPDRVTAMIQSSSGGYNLNLLQEEDGFMIEERLSATEWDSLNYWRRQLANSAQSERSLRKRAEFLAPAYLYDDSQVPTVADRLLQGNMRINQLVWSDMRRIEFDCEEFLESFEKPVLILHGKQDVVQPELARNAHELLPNSQLIMLDRCGHYGWLDRPDKYFRSIGTFLKEITQVYD